MPPFFVGVMMKLKSSGYAQEYWNGKKYVQFPQGFYETDDLTEVAFLLGCQGVSEVYEEVKAEAVDPDPPRVKDAEEKPKKNGKAKKEEVDGDVPPAL